MKVYEILGFSRLFFVATITQILLEAQNLPLICPINLGPTARLKQDYFTNKVCSVGKSGIPRDVTQGNPLRPSP